MEHFSSPITNADEKVFSFTIGSPDGQQTREALAILVALRLWQPIVLDKRVVLKITGDNVGALMLTSRMRPSTPPQAIIARELALLFSDSAFIPDIVHTPGVAHVVADGLSRMHEPSVQDATIAQHFALANSTERNTKPRTRTGTGHC